jgi:glycosyltransferase involved in cell wall biosynthesis
MKRLCVIIPAYNEEKVIFEVVRGILKVLGKEGEVVVIDDASLDRTGERARKAGAVVISHFINIGVGGTTSTGLRYAAMHGFEWAITMDGDGQHDAKDALRCLKEASRRGVDLMIGSRLIDRRGMSKVKVFGNVGLSFITWLLFQIKVTDSQSGLRVFSRKAMDVLEWRSTGYDFCSEMIWRARQMGLMISETSIKAVYTEYSRKKGQNNWNGVNIVKSLVRRRVLEMFE